MNDNLKKLITVGAKGRIICSVGIMDRDIDKGMDEPPINHGTKVKRTGSFEVMEVRSKDFIVSVLWDAIPENLMDEMTTPAMYCLYPSTKKDGTQDYKTTDKGFSNLYISTRAISLEGSQGERTTTDIVEYRFDTAPTSPSL